MTPIAFMHSVIVVLGFLFDQLKAVNGRLELNRCVLQLMGIVNIIPWKFTDHGLRAKSGISKLRWNIWIWTFGLGMTYTVYINGALLHTFSQGLKNVRYDQLGVHMLRSLMSTTFTYWAYEFFVAHSEKHEMLYNFVQGNPALQKRRHYKVRASEFQELVLAMTPMMLYIYCPFYTVIFLLDTTQKQFVFSLLPKPCHDSMALKLLVASIEFWLMLFWMAASHFAIVHGITFVRTVQASLADSASGVDIAGRDNGASTVESECKLLRRVQLVMNVFNLSASGMVFAHKLLDNVGAIAGFYFFIRLIFVQPAVSFMFFLFVLDCMVFWTSMADNMPFIPVMTAGLKRRLTVAAAGNGYVKRVLRSMPCRGVHVGGFRSMERDSTVIYLDFVFTNVIIMLITFA